MGIFSKLFRQDPESEKQSQFLKIEKQFNGDLALIRMAKVTWLNFRGKHFLSATNFAQPGRDFMEAIKLDPTFIQSYISLAMTFGVQGRYEDVVHILENTPKDSKFYQNEDYFGLHFSLGLAYMEMNNKEKAIANFQDCLEAYEAIKTDSSTQKDIKALKDAGVLTNEDEESESSQIEMLAVAKRSLAQLREIN